MYYQIRNAEPADLVRIEEIYAYARLFMAAHGNPNQWGTTNPPHGRLVQDIQERLLYVLEDDSGIHGVFYFYIGPDPTYASIWDGSWKYDSPYGTIHRIASDGSKGILRTAVEYCLTKSRYLRIDTHHDNIVMQNALDKLNFQKSGIIYIADGTPRIAYEYCEHEKTPGI